MLAEWPQASSLLQSSFLQSPPCAEPCHQSTARQRGKGLELFWKPPSQRQMLREGGSRGIPRREPGPGARRCGRAGRRRRARRPRAPWS
uniref:Preprotein translocase secA subunit, putative n=1 Tax=Arundo donax TaxID=35708 RepID=A0A0A9E6A1_ARUDO